MRIPFWQRDQAHPTKAIDRLQDNRSVRQLVGLWTAQDFSAVSASLVHVKGAGKYARYREVAHSKLEIEETAQRVLLDLKNESSPIEADVQFASSELTTYQVNCCHTLMSRSGVQASEIVAVGAVDPGIRLVDFEDKPVFRSLTNATELASRTSITVIDRFAERDIVDGGNGNHLYALGYWFLLGDRNPKIANENRLLVLNDNQMMNVFFLPASDGLDAVLPKIELTQIAEQDEKIRRRRIRELFANYRQIEPEMSLVVVVNDKKTIESTDEEIEFTTVSEFGYQSIKSIACAFLANAFVDQLPVSIPELTGNQNPRVLGTLTPGSLVNFRNFVLQTSKVAPSIMKLRDAI